MIRYTKSIIFIISIYMILLSGCSVTPNTKTKLANLSALGKNEPVIVTTEPISILTRGDFAKIPVPDLTNLKNYGWDLRSYDLKSYNLINHSEELQYVIFDTKTSWPKDLPSSFDPTRIMELGRDPGLNIRSLHNRGITGRGVNIAIIDQPLLLEHEEYKDNIMLYERLNCLSTNAAMHGTSVVSIAVGKNIGVAPDAKVYYIASTFGKMVGNEFVEDLTLMADGINRVLEINKHLPESEKIKVISISKGFDYDVKGSAEVYNAIERAKQAGVFVITTSTSKNFNFNLMGLGRNQTANPNDINSYRPGLFWEDVFNSGKFTLDNLLLVPMDARTCAFNTGKNDYVFSSNGGLSWTCPWLAGLYALCVQVNPHLTPDEFINIAFETGDEVIIYHESRQYSLKTLINPEKLIRAIEQYL